MVGKHQSGESGFCCRSVKSLLRLSNAPVSRNTFKTSDFLPRPCIRPCAHPQPLQEARIENWGTGQSSHQGSHQKRKSYFSGFHEKQIGKSCMNHDPSHFRWVPSCWMHDNTNFSFSVYCRYLRPPKRVLISLLEKDKVPPSSLEFSTSIFKMQQLFFNNQEIQR